MKSDKFAPPELSKNPPYKRTTESLRVADLFLQVYWFSKFAVSKIVLCKSHARESTKMVFVITMAPVLQQSIKFSFWKDFDYFDHFYAKSITQNLAGIPKIPTEIYPGFVF